MSNLVPIIRRFEAQDIVPALAIAETAFGANYISAHDLEGDTGLQAFVAVADRTVVGFGLVKATSASRTLNKLGDLPLDVNLAVHDGKVALIQTVAVHAEHRRHGIGEALLLSMQDFLEKLGKRLIVVPAWKNKNGVSLAGILARNAYEPFMLFKRYWKDSCDRKEFACPSRTREDTCGCDAVWYKKAL